MTNHDATPEFLPATILDAHDETTHLRSLRIRFDARFAAAHATPGQILKVRVSARDDAGEAVDKAAYLALASAPRADGVAELLVRRGGAVADMLLGEAMPGAWLDLSAPFGRGFPVDAAREHDLLLFAAGSGIAPLRAVVQHVIAHRGDYGRVALYYGQRHAGEFAYEVEAGRWRLEGVAVRLCRSRPGEDRGPVGSLHADGRVQDVARAEAFGGADPGRAVAFVCGMKEMVTGVRATLEAAGFDAQRIFQNY